MRFIVGRGQKGGRFRGGGGPGQWLRHGARNGTAQGWRRGRQPRRGDVGSMAERDGGWMERETLHCRPEIQGIALGMAGEAVIDLPIKLDGEVRVGSRRTAGDWTGAAKLGSSPPGRPKADQLQHLGHGDPLTKLAVVDARHKGLGGWRVYVASGFGGSDAFLARWTRYDLPRIFRRMAPSTTRSRKAIASGGSPK